MTRQRGAIGFWACVTFAVGSMVGAGVFVLSGVAIQAAGPAALISFGLAGLAVLCSATSFMVITSVARPGELGYAPVGEVLGNKFWGFLTAWAFYISSIICTAFVLNAFGMYMHNFFLPGTSALLLALVAAVVMTLINLGPASKISRIEGTLVFVKVAILFLLILFGLQHISGHDFQPFVPHGTESVIATSGLLFIAYLGFSVVTNIAADVKNPRKTVPRAILWSIILVAILYGGVVIALLSTPLAHYDEASIGQVAATLMGPAGGVLVAFAALVSTLSAANSNILGSSEIMVRLARQKEVPTAAGRLWRGHPIVSVLFGAIIYIALLLSGQTQLIITTANVAAILAIMLVNVAAIKLLFTKRHGGMRIIGGPVLPLLGLIGCVVQLFVLGPLQLLIGAVLVGSGSIVYLYRKRLHHRAHHQELVQSLNEHGGPLERALYGRTRASNSNNLKT